MIFHLFGFSEEKSFINVGLKVFILKLFSLFVNLNIFTTFLEHALVTFVLMITIVLLRRFSQVGCYGLRVSLCTVHRLILFVCNGERGRRDSVILFDAIFFFHIWGILVYRCW